MLTKNEGQGKSMTPVIPNKVDKAKVHRVKATTDVDWEDDVVPPSTPCLMKEIQQMMDQDVARSLTNKPRTEFGLVDLKSRPQSLKPKSKNMTPTSREACIMPMKSIPRMMILHLSANQ